MKMNLFRTMMIVMISVMAVNAQSKDSCTYATIAGGKINEAKQQMANIERQVADIRKERKISSAQMEQISNALDSIADSQQVAYESALKSAEYAARTEGKNGNVDILRDYKAFADFKAEKGISIKESIERMVDEVNKGSIKQIIDKTKTPSVPDSERILEKSYFVNTKFENSSAKQTEIQKNPFWESQTTILPNVQFDCFMKCYNRQWGECLKCLFNLACQIVGNSGTGTGGNTGSSSSNYQNCINSCNSLPLFKRLACKAKCIFS